MFVGLVHPNLELRVLAPDDAPTLFALVNCNRLHLRQWLPWLDASQSLEDTSRYIHAAIRQYQNNQGFHAGIWYDKNLCGVISHHAIDWTNRSTSLGYWMDKDHQGKGIMTSACRYLVQHAFREWGLHRVVIRCALENHRSRAIPERLGFKFEGIARQAEWLYDHFVDLAVYSRLASDSEEELAAS